MGKGKAIVAIARKLLVVVWHVLTKQVGDCHADVAMVTRKLQRWGKQHGLATQLGLSSGAFARLYLRHLGLDPTWKEGGEISLGSELLPALAAHGS